MTLMQSLRDALTPHVNTLVDHGAFHAAAIHNKLSAIEKAVSDLGRGDIGNKWQRIVIKKAFAGAETVELIQCPLNEIMLIQSISSDGVQEKSPAFILEANGILIESIIKEGLGFEGIGGNQVLLPGEVLSVTSRAAGNVNCVITVIRQPIPMNPVSADVGHDVRRASMRNTHETSRDAIAERMPQTYQEPTPQTISSEGRTG